MTTPENAAAPAGTVGAVVRLLEVSADDLRIVTQAIFNNDIHEWTSGGGREHVDCRFCGEEHEWDWERNAMIREHHKPDCAVLVARSIQPNDAIDRQTGGAQR